MPELALPDVEEGYVPVPDEAFLPYHISEGYTMDITPLMDQGIWSLRLKEPDGGVENSRDAVPGRFFTTRVGLRLNEKGYTEMGIRIDVTDPASEEKEVDFAFRPGFVRALAVQPSVVFEHVRELGYGCPLRVSTPEEYKKFQYMLDNEDNQLPLVVFTHYRQGEKKAPSVSLEEFMKSEPVKSLLQSPGLGFGMPGKKDMPMPDMSSVSGMPALRPGVVVTVEKKVVRTAGAAAYVPPAGPTASDVSAPAAVPVLLHDAEAFARSVFGYALTVVLGDEFFDKFSSRVKKEIRPGDIVLCGARRFRGEVSVIGAFAGTEEEKLKKAYSAALLAAQSYSKHKAPYDFGSVVFEAEARKLERQKELKEILESGTLEEKERYERLALIAEEQKTVINEKDEKIDRLEKQCAEEFARGQAFSDQEYAALEEENSDLRKELTEKKDWIEQMQGSFQMARDIIGLLDELRSVPELPETREDVVQYFRKVYTDRIDFTDRGLNTASKCDLKPASLWQVLYATANDLVDLYRNSTGNLLEKDVQEATGFQASFGEGSMTRENSGMMRLREDVYEGKVISVEPHLKLRHGKEETEKQRLHFWYDPYKRRIVISYLGEHLDSVSGRRKT